MIKNSRLNARPFARAIAKELTVDEIDLVAGGEEGHPAAKCVRTVTGCEQSRDGVITCSDSDTCPA